MAALGLLSPKTKMKRLRFESVLDQFVDETAKNQRGGSEDRIDTSPFHCS
jgi:hypothetical protein